MGLMDRIFLPASLDSLTRQAVLLVTSRSNLDNLSHNRATSRSNSDNPHNRAAFRSNLDSPYSSHPGMGSRLLMRSQRRPIPRSTISRRDRQHMRQRVLIAA